MRQASLEPKTVRNKHHKDGCTSAAPTNVFVVLQPCIAVKLLEFLPLFVLDKETGQQNCHPVVGLTRQARCD